MSAPHCTWVGPLPGMPAGSGADMPAVRRLPDEALDVAAAWQVLAEVWDPEVPAVSIVDLGIVREIALLPRSAAERPGVKVALTPTYSGCPATEAITAAVDHALRASGFGAVSIELRRAPAWTTDWISEHGRQRLREAGIAPPPGTPARTIDGPGTEWPLRRMPRPGRPAPDIRADVRADIRTDHDIRIGTGTGTDNGTDSNSGQGRAVSDTPAVDPAVPVTAVPVTAVPVTAVAVPAVPVPAVPVPCPRCDSLETDCLSAFGSTACKALYRCRACREPFEFFKPF